MTGVETGQRRLPKRVPGCIYFRPEEVVVLEPAMNGGSANADGRRRVGYCATSQKGFEHRELAGVEGSRGFDNLGFSCPVSSHFVAFLWMGVY
ncbi:MAG: hypothetical protein P3C09_12325 [Gemmatimonadota bacterium]|nr:hypothetical protein [Gemmatimonadota bacterium]